MAAYANRRTRRPPGIPLVAGASGLVRIKPSARARLRRGVAMANLRQAVAAAICRMDLSAAAATELRKGAPSFLILRHFFERSATPFGAGKCAAAIKPPALARNRNFFPKAHKSHGRPLRRPVRHRNNRSFVAITVAAAENDYINSEINTLNVSGEGGLS